MEAFSYEWSPVKPSLIITLQNWLSFQWGVRPEVLFNCHIFKLLWFLSTCVCIKSLEILKVKNLFLGWKRAEGENTVSYVRQCGGGLQVRNKFGSGFCQKDTWQNNYRWGAGKCLKKRKVWIDNASVQGNFLF